MTKLGPKFTVFSTEQPSKHVEEGFQESQEGRELHFLSKAHARLQHVFARAWWSGRGSRSHSAPVRVPRQPQVVSQARGQCMTDNAITHD